MKKYLLNYRSDLHTRPARSQAPAWERNAFEALPHICPFRIIVCIAVPQAEPAIQWGPKQSLGTSWWRSARSVYLHSILILLALLGGSAWAGEGPSQFVTKYCVDCHGSNTPERGLDLQSLDFQPADAANMGHWVKLHDKVRDGEMPPKDAEQPSDEERAVMIRELAKKLTEADQTRQVAFGRSVIRRLNRVEFETALGDLLHIPLRIRELLPPDANGAGFDTVGAALSVSAVQLESYLQAIDVGLDEATKLIERPPVKKWRLSYLESHNMMQVFRKGGPHTPMPDGMAMFAKDSYAHMNSLLDHFVVPHSARYRVKVAARAVRSEEPITLTVRLGGGGNKEDDEIPRTLLGNVSVYEAPEGEGQVFEFESYLEFGQMFRIYPSSLRKMRFAGPAQEGAQKNYQGPAVVVQWIEVEGPFYESWPPPSHERLWAGVKSEPIPGVQPNEDLNEQLEHPPTETAKPRMTIGPVDPITGNKRYYDPKQGVGGEPIYRQRRVKEPLHSTRSLTTVQPKEDAVRLLINFATAAFRRPASEAETQPFVALVHRWLDQGVDFEQAMRAGYKAILTSPGFLYQQSGRALEPAETELSQYEIAERLAFFLWSSLPDEALLQAAAEGKLTDASTLSNEAERMLRDPKAKRFLDHFLGQWLDLRLIDFTAPDTDLYPEFDELLQWSLVEETKAFFHELLTHDLSIRNAIDSDFAMVNDRLAKHYRLTGVEGIGLRKVKLSENSVRGGVLAQGSVLKVTANGTTTSPVVRGKWVMERIMGIPPEPPPPGISAIEPDIRGATTVRQQLELHRSVESCAVCHCKIDPPGVALESFDVIGGWRDRYRILTSTDDMKAVTYGPENPPPLRYTQGLPVDAADELADGRQFKDIVEFKKLLLEDPDQIARTVVSKLVVYATGAPVSFADRQEIERILEMTRSSDHGFRSLVHAVIQSRLFQTR